LDQILSKDPFYSVSSSCKNSHYSKSSPNPPNENSQNSKSFLLNLNEGLLVERELCCKRLEGTWNTRLIWLKLFFSWILANSVKQQRNKSWERWTWRRFRVFFKRIRYFSLSNVTFPLKPLLCPNFESRKSGPQLQTPTPSDIPLIFSGNFPRSWFESEVSNF